MIDRGIGLLKGLEDKAASLKVWVGELLTLKVALQIRFAAN